MNFFESGDEEDDARRRNFELWNMEWLESRVGDNSELIPLDEIQEEVWSKLSGDFMEQNNRMQQVA